MACFDKLLKSNSDEERIVSDNNLNTLIFDLVPFEECQDSVLNWKGHFSLDNLSFCRVHLSRSLCFGVQFLEPCCSVTFCQRSSVIGKSSHTGKKIQSYCPILLQDKKQ